MVKTRRGVGYWFIFRLVARQFKYLVAAVSLRSWFSCIYTRYAFLVARELKCNTCQDFFRVAMVADYDLSYLVVYTMILIPSFLCWVCSCDYYFTMLLLKILIKLRMNTIKNKKMMRQIYTPYVNMRIFSNAFLYQSSYFEINCHDHFNFLRKFPV